VQFFYVYLLRSESSSEHYYVGFTEDPAQRLNEHNDGKLPKTARFRPCHTKSAHAFREKVRALAFEKYLKSASGRAFAKKRLWYASLRSLHELRLGRPLFVRGGKKSVLRPVRHSFSDGGNPGEGDITQVLAASDGLSSRCDPRSCLDGARSQPPVRASQWGRTKMAADLLFIERDYILRPKGHERRLRQLEKETKMKSAKRKKNAYAIVHHFPGGTKAQYAASIAAVHPGRNRLPKGQIFHAAGASAGGWTVVAVHESKASWKRFRDDILMPRMKQGIKGGFKTPPQETAIAVRNLRP
jgi:predicted GIY-YIG superfamily endonuclease